MLPSCKLVVIVLLSAATVKVDLATIVQAPRADANWWKNAVIYQVYTRSFKDSGNNDGVGDIQGIIEKLDYLKDSGVTTIWLPPIQKSLQVPKVDFGYEVTDYQGIHEEYGTIGDFEQLITQAHARGIKIIIEIVPNHSSDQHVWFQESRKDSTNEFASFYVWKAGVPETPPNNWLSHFGGSAWTYDDLRKEWYLHQFGVEQPDLNYRTPAVRDEMKKVLEFWLGKDVDGFILSDVPYLVEDEELTPEEPSDIGEVGDYESLIHEYTSNQPETYALISEWRSVIDDYNAQNIDKDPRVLITKAETDLEKAWEYCGKGDLKGAHFTYNFLLASDLSQGLTAQNIYNSIEKWILHMPQECGVENWVLGNHDMHRVASRFPPQLVDGLNILLSFLPGVMITYNGEEIGQENGEVTFEQCKDPIACKDEDNYNEVTRDFERTPFHWDETANAGFTTGTPWLPVSDKHTTSNLKLQSRAGYTSHYHNYQALTKLRLESDFSTAPLQYKVSENVIALIKQTIDEQVYVAIINTAETSQTVNLSDIEILEKYLKVIVANSVSKKHNRVLSTNNVILDGYESVIVKALPDQPEGRSDWWENALVYQIYPLSFKDNDNNGFGDIQGIISKLQYLKDTGVTAVWLSPIYESPQVDAGYDISDYRKIDTRFGENADEDFDDMVAKARELGIKIIMDFVPNHSSNKHDWFIKSENREEGFEDYYVWHAGTNGGNDPPNNWISLFKNSAWTKSEKRNEYYLHQFAEQQPDLNYENPLVVDDMKDILKFWMDRGVDGFRMDAVPYLFEDGSFADEPALENGVPENEHGSLNHIYTSDQPGTFDMIYQWREYVDDYTKEHGGDARILMTEAYTDIVNTMKYYGDENRDGAQFTFNFQLITRLNNNYNAPNIKAAIDEWTDNMPIGRVANWVIGNHDNHRVATRFTPKNVDGFNMLIAMLPGVMVTYNGEEIGQENGEVTWKEGEDPSACNGEEADFDKTSRDFERTPFHWDDTTNAGFNEGFKPWLPVSAKYTELNLADQNVPEKQSHYNVYKEIVKLRSNPILLDGALAVEAISDNLLAVKRTKHEDICILLFNVGDEMETYELNTVADVTPFVKVLAMSSESLHRVGDLIVSDKLALNSHESVIIVTTTDTPVTTNPPSTTPDGAAAITISFITFVVALTCSVLMH